MTVTKNQSRFEGPWRRADAPIGQVGRFGGMGTGVALDADWHYEATDFGIVGDALRVVNSHTAPTTGGDGTTWEIDAIGAAPTLAVNVNGFPPHLAITTTAVDTQGYNAQRSVASSNARTTFSPGLGLGLSATCEEFYMYMVVKFSDANFNAATVQQMRFFMGFAAVNTNLFGGAVTNFIGINKRDGDGILRMVSDDDAVGVNAATNQKVCRDLTTGSRTGTPAQNTWLGLGLHVILDPAALTNNRGIAHSFYDNGKRSSFAADPDPTHMGSMALNEVPDAALAASFAFVTGEAVAKTLTVAKIIVAGRYRLGSGL